MNLFYVFEKSMWLLPIILLVVFVCLFLISIIKFSILNGIIEKIKSFIKFK